MYVGPEVLVPAASALAALGGFLLMFWRRTLALLRRAVRRVVPGRRAAGAADTDASVPEAVQGSGRSKNRKSKNRGAKGRKSRS